MEETNVQNTETTAIELEKTFTQAEVDALIARRLERERKKYPAEEELTAFKSWKERQAEERDMLEVRTRERDEARAALEQLRRESFLTEKGVPREDADYYAYRIGKLVTAELSFEQAAEQFLKERQPAERVRVETGAQLGGGRAATANEAMNELLRGIRK